MRRRFASIGVGVLMAAAWVGIGSAAGSRPAAAHDGPIQVSPGNLATVGGEVSAVTLFFLEAVTSATFEVATPGGSLLSGVVDLGQADRASYRFHPLTVEGRYVVSYRVDFADGAVSEGAFLFNYDAEAPPPALVTATPREERPRWLLLSAPAAALALVGTSVIFLRRRRAGRQEPASG